jgi:hypothetical protein
VAGHATSSGSGHHFPAALGLDPVSPLVSCLITAPRSCRNRWHACPPYPIWDDGAGQWGATTTTTTTETEEVACVCALLSSSSSSVNSCSSLSSLHQLAVASRPVWDGSARACTRSLVQSCWVVVVSRAHTVVVLPRKKRT